MLLDSFLASCGCTGGELAVAGGAGSASLFSPAGWNMVVVVVVCVSFFFFWFVFRFGNVC